ncbi:Histidine kinase (plasmid) [Rhodovastum atsumiense]|uniref:ATP-binding protein n=1 Tax=Rhodovastum atsumiense TaxID=504468 RepID=UPI002024AC02|nr:ATP-binding protein [Rhodovastum atsumiense]CAH2605600.1 Histidine kinase [Rhodovastum atsumiense]
MRQPWAVVAIALVWGVAAIHLTEGRSDTLRAAEANGASRAQAYADALLRGIVEIDHAALLVRALDERGTQGPDIATWLDALVPMRHIPMRIMVLGPDGKVRLSTPPGPFAHPDLSDQTHFRRFAASSGDGLHISPPLPGQAPEAWTLPFLRLLRGPDGSFNGLVVVSVAPRDLLGFASVADVGAQGTVTLFGADGMILARVAATDMRMTTGDVSTSPVVADAVRTAAGHLTWTDLHDRTRRIESFRRLPGLPLVLSVGLAEDEVLAEHRGDIGRAVLVSLVLTLVVILASLAESRHRRRREQAQRELNLAMENISQGLLMVEPSGRVAVMNGRLAELLDLPPHLRQGSHIEDVTAWQVAAGEFTGAVEPPEATALIGQMAGFFSNVLPLYKRTRPNGTVLEVRTRVLPDRSVVRTFSDVTAWEQAQAALQAAREAAEAGVQARTQFLAVMSHEIRTPLNGILGAAELLHDTPLSPQQERYVRTVRDSGRHLLDLLNDILDFSKIDRGAIELEMAPFAPAGLLAAVRTIMAPLAEEKGLWLSVEVDEQVPAQVCGDAHRLRQVLLNLMGNAIKFTHTGGIAVQLGATPAGLGWRLDFRVRDSGVGIPADLQGHLFQEFAQADGSITRRFGGTGLGLAISRRLVIAMGGDIAVDSREGEGAEFRFHIMVRLSCAVSVTSEASNRVGRLRVLLAEDNHVNRLVASGLLEKLGHQVETVEDGAAALAVVQRGGVDLVLMDVMMPVMDGLAATRAIRALPGTAGRVPVIGLTANAFRDDEAECRAAGMDGFAPKPITRERLAREIEHVCGTAGPEKAVLDTLAETLGKETLAEVVTTFLKDVPNQLVRLRALAKGTAMPELTREAHTLAGSAGTLGLRGLEMAARSLENDLRRDAPVDAPGRVAAIEVLAQQAVAALVADHVPPMPGMGGACSPACPLVRHPNPMPSAR